MRRLFCALATALATSTMIAAQTRADTITFVDLTDTITVSHTGTDTTISSGTCPAEGALCVIALSRGTQTITSPLFTFTLSEDPSRQIFSDSVNVSTGVGVELDFASDIDGSNFRCPGVVVRRRRPGRRNWPARSPGAAAARPIRSLSNPTQSPCRNQARCSC